jgi:ABC-2 type transport system permease protein
MKKLNYLQHALKYQLKLMLTLRISFFINLIAILLKQGFFIITWKFFFNKYTAVNSWEFTEMLAMYGLVSFGTGVVEMFFYGVRNIPSLVETNQIDYLLTQPQNILLSVALSKGDVTAFAEIIYGFLLLLLSGYLKTHLLWLFMLLPLSALFIFSLHVYVGSLSFFLKNSQGLLVELYRNANTLATQPNSAYGRFLKILTLTVLPVAYLSFFPVEFLRTHLLFYIILSYLGTLGFFGIACWLFYKGLSHYESGSTFSYRY